MENPITTIGFGNGFSLYSASLSDIKIEEGTNNLYIVSKFTGNKSYFVLAKDAFSVDSFYLSDLNYLITIKRF